MKVATSAIVITGGASGLGLEFARHTAGLGARVWALDRAREAIAAARAAADEAAAVEFVECDVGVEAQVVETVAAIEQASGGIDVLVNNAAILRDHSLVSKIGKQVRRHSLADWDETIRCNLTSAFLMAREVADAMIRARRGGLIVNVSSISRHGNRGQTAYAATKAAIDALTVTWSQELAIYGIRVLALAPGFVETPMTRRIPPLFLESIRERTPIGRFGTLAEFGHALQFAIENDYLNGKVLELDGGLRF
jgi:3-oxoacyl-[acyl-carrier protein] reductase